MWRLFSFSDRSEVYLGDENAVTLTFNARNEGEGGAYEAELYVVLPSEADYSGIARNSGVRLLHQGCSDRRADLHQRMKRCWAVNIPVMGVVFVSSPELHSADLQLWGWKPDPLSCVRSGKPHEVWYQCKNPERPLRCVALHFRPPELICTLPLMW